MYTAWSETAALFAYQCFPVDCLNWFREHMELRDCDKGDCTKGRGMTKSKGSQRLEGKKKD
jgi:hypothetical protein